MKRRTLLLGVDTAASSDVCGGDGSLSPLPGYFFLRKHFLFLLYHLFSLTLWAARIGRRRQKQ